ASSDWTLGSGFENLSAMGSVKVELHGNNGANVLTGNDAGDYFNSRAGDDTMVGGAGNDNFDMSTGGIGNIGMRSINGAAGSDTLSGSYGNDSYPFGRGDGADLIREANRGGDGWWADNRTTGDSDTLQLGTGIAADQVWFERAGNDLVASVIGTSDRVTVE